MKKINYIYCTLALCGLVSAVSSCRSDEALSDDEGVMQVPVSFMVQSTGLKGTLPGYSGKSANPQETNPRDLYTDRVQVNVYKRDKNKTYTNDEDGFVFDHKVTLKCVPVGDGNRYRKATGVIDFKSDFEYRTTALAYSEEKKETSLYSFTSGLTNFTDAGVSLIQEPHFTAPELFFGIPRYGATPDNKDGGKVVFVTNQNDKEKIFGILYRCVSGIELTLTDVPTDVTGLTLYTGKLHTKCKATKYDDFLKPGGMMQVNPIETGTFVLAEWNRPTNEVGITTAKLMDINLLPVDQAPLYIKITMNDNSQSIVHLRLKRKGTLGQADGSYPEEGSGTGIVPDPDVRPDDPIISNGDMNFKRNNYYRIEGSYGQLTTAEIPLIVTINPFWDGDYEMDLDKDNQQ